MKKIVKLISLLGPVFLIPTKSISNESSIDTVELDIRSKTIRTHYNTKYLILKDNDQQIAIIDLNEIKLKTVETGLNNAEIKVKNYQNEEINVNLHFLDSYINVVTHDPLFAPPNGEVRTK